MTNELSISSITAHEEMDIGRKKGMRTRAADIQTIQNRSATKLPHQMSTKTKSINVWRQQTFLKRKMIFFLMF